MRLWIPLSIAAAGSLVLAMLVMPDWDMPPKQTEQLGYRGTGMNIIRDMEDEAALKAANVVPEPPYEADPSGPPIAIIYENIQVLGHLSEDEHNRLMTAFTEWVAPEEEGCNFCHNPDNMASDEKYQKVVARRMIQMTQAINANWQSHVLETGVTCYTCHRGETVPPNTWSRDTGPQPTGGYIGYRAGQNVVAKYAGTTALPQNHLEAFLLGDEPIAVHSQTAFPTGANTTDLTNAENSFALMIHMSEALGVGCVTCHNTRALDDWDQSPPQRVTAWHGIRMAREINKTYIEPLTSVVPKDRLGPEGDILKVSCATCHNSVQKPLYGVAMLKDYLKSFGAVTSAPITGAPTIVDTPPIDRPPAGETAITPPAEEAAITPPAAVGDDAAGAVPPASITDAPTVVDTPPIDGPPQPAAAPAAADGGDAAGAVPPAPITGAPTVVDTPPIDGPPQPVQ